RSPLRLVDAEPVEAAREIVCQRGGSAVLVVEDEHPDAAGLAIAASGERDRTGRSSRRLQLASDRVELERGAGAEEGERDVQVGRRHRAEVAVRQPSLPRDDAPDGVVRERERAEKANAGIALDATSARHPSSSRFCDKRRRSRWSAATAARERIVSRSPGSVNSSPCP